MSPKHNKRGRLMHHTTLMVLLLLMFGQFCILGFAAFVLWLAGEFGDPPNWRGLRSLHKSGGSDAELRLDATATTSDE